MKDQPDDQMARASRRNFLKLTGGGAFTAAMVAGAAGMLWSDAAVAQTRAEETEREKAAEFTMVIATEYVLGASRSYPLMQLDLKENIQNTTNGRVYVKLAPGGQLGAGGELVQKVQSGTIQAAQFSLSNFAPFAPAVDLVNLPYFCGSNQQFTNLVHSPAWRDAVHGAVEQRGFRILMYMVIDPRTVALRRGAAKPAILPDDLRGVKFRVPGSQLLQQYYRLLGANPTPIAWGETSSAIKQGVADALDPAVGALEIFGFRDVLSHITFTRFVPDSQCYACNFKWYDALPGEVKEAIDFAAEITTQQNLAKVPAARAYSMAQMRQSGVEFHSLDADQLAAWKEAGGYQRSEWEQSKLDLAGSMDVFTTLEEAVATQGRYYVNDA